jgi:hypothetical protein
MLIHRRDPAPHVAANAFSQRAVRIAIGRCTNAAAPRPSGLCGRPSTGSIVRSLNAALSHTPCRTLDMAAWAAHLAAAAAALGSSGAGRRIARSSASCAADLCQGSGASVLASDLYHQPRFEAALHCAQAHAEARHEAQTHRSSLMTKIAFVYTSMAVATFALALSPAAVEAQTRVQYGRITNVVATTVNNSTSQNVGTLVGGGVGLATGSGQSSSNRALRVLGGAAAGRGVGTLSGQSQAFEYTVLIGGTTTTRFISDQAGKRVGDCVAIEQGQFNNIRLVPDARCALPAPRPAAPAPAPAPAPIAVPPAEMEAASACDQAKQQVLSAETDEALSLAERRMRLLCGE